MIEDPDCKVISLLLEADYIHKMRKLISVIVTVMKPAIKITAKLNYGNN